MSDILNKITAEEQAALQAITDQQIALPQAFADALDKAKNELNANMEKLNEAFQETAKKYGALKDEALANMKKQEEAESLAGPKVVVAVKKKAKV